MENYGVCEVCMESGFDPYLEKCPYCGSDDGLSVMDEKTYGEYLGGGIDEDAN